MATDIPGLIAQINSQINTNGTGNISGPVLNQNLIDMVTLLQNEVKPYKEYEVILDQSSSSDPTANQQINDLSGVPTYKKIADGTYTVTLNDAFTQNKTTILFGPGLSSGSFYAWEWNSKNQITIFSLDINGAKKDDLFNNTTMIVKVHD
jgi:hypothetical protein